MVRKARVPGIPTRHSPRFPYVITEAQTLLALQEENYELRAHLTALEENSCTQDNTPPSPVPTPEPTEPIPEPIPKPPFPYYKERKISEPPTLDG